MANNPNHKANLRSLGDLPVEERRAIARKAGKASGRARNFKAVVKDMLAENDNYAAVVEAILQRAKEDGDVAAATWLRDTAGEKPVEERRDQIDGNIEIGWKE